MATDLAPAAPDVDTVAVTRRGHLLRGRLMLAFAAWNLWVWTTRLFTLTDDTTEYSIGFVVVHLLLFAGGLGGAVVFAVIGRRMVKESRA